MLRHVVVFTWTSDAGADAKRAVAEALAALPATVTTIRDYRFGSDAGVNEGNCDFAVVADFDDVDGYLIYRDHPAHQRVIRDLIAPILANRHAVQFTWE
ncbi:MAG: Dabb family protein [Acidimicrobiia bacterium]|nr:Dabb family protein [Acidimicrobiia bacterium]